MAKWSKIFDHDHGQNFKMTVVKWSKLVIFDHEHGQNFKITEVNWSKLVNLTIDHGKITGCHGHGQFFDHRPWGKFQGVMVMVSALPPPQLNGAE